MSFLIFDRFTVALCLYPECSSPNAFSLMPEQWWGITGIWQSHTRHVKIKIKTNSFARKKKKTTILINFFLKYFDAHAHRYLIEVDSSLGRCKSAKLRDKFSIIVPSFFTTFQNEWKLMKINENEWKWTKINENNEWMKMFILLSKEILL